MHVTENTDSIRRGHNALAAVLGLLAVSLLSLPVWAEPVSGATEVGQPQIALSTTPDIGDLVSLEPLDVHPRTSLTIVEQLRHNHYLTKPLDDHLSGRIFEKYLQMLD